MVKATITASLLIFPRMFELIVYPEWFMIEDIPLVFIRVRILPLGRPVLSYLLSPVWGSHRMFHCAVTVM